MGKLNVPVNTADIICDSLRPKQYSNTGHNALRFHIEKINLVSISWTNTSTIHTNMNIIV